MEAGFPIAYSEHMPKYDQFILCGTFKPIRVLMAHEHSQMQV